jgi:predicted transcriptional regulator
MSAEYVNVGECVADRVEFSIYTKGFKSVHDFATFAAIPYETIKSILFRESKSPKISTIKKICDGFDITLAQFFDTPEFNNLDWETEV